MGCLSHVGDYFQLLLTISIDLIKLRFEYWIYTILVNSKYLTEVLIRQKVNYEHVHCKGLLIYFVYTMLTIKKKNFECFFFNKIKTQGYTLLFRTNRFS